MIESRLVKVYDEYYDEIFRKILSVSSDREYAKNLMGDIFRETGALLKDGTKESIKSVLFGVLLSRGIS